MASACRRSRRERDGTTVARLYSRTGEDISKGFPDLLDALRLPGAIDGELLIMRDRRVQSFNVLQQRLNRKIRHAETARRNFPRICAPTISLPTATRICAALPFAERRDAARNFCPAQRGARRPFAAGPVHHLGRTRGGAQKPGGGAGADAAAVEGVMLKRRDALYLPGRPKGPWWKWKRDPFIIDAVLMYAQRGHGKRSSLLFRLHVRRLDAGESRRRTRAGRQGLFRLHR